MEIVGLRFHLFPLNYLIGISYGGVHSRLTFFPFFQFTDEEVERCYEEFYEDVHTEFLKYGEIVNFKVSCDWYLVVCMVYIGFWFVLFFVLSEQ